MKYQPLPQTSPPTQVRRPADDTGEITIMLSHPQGGGGRRVEIRITDEASHERLVDITLTPEEFTDLLSSKVMRLTACIPNAEQTSHLFREREQDTRKVPAELGGRYDYESNDGVRARIDTWASQIATSEGWEQHRVETGSQSFYATFRRWGPREPVCGSKDGQFTCDYKPNHKGAHGARRTSRELVATWDDAED